MKESGPKVSVVLPVFNARNTLEWALSSVLCQAHSDMEILVCDDGSKDGSREIALELLSDQDGHRRRVLNAGGVGPGGARNVGIRAARGQYIAFLDDDDMWHPDKLSACVQELDRDGLDLVCHAEVWEDQVGRRRVRRYRDLFHPSLPPVVSLMRNNPFSTSAVVVRRDRLLEAGLFDESLPSAEDYDLWIRLSLLPGFRIGFIDKPLGTYTLRRGSESSAVDRRLRALTEIGRKYRMELLRASRYGRLESWMYAAKTQFTTGLRYLQQGRFGWGLAMTAKGFLMWPFRFDWIALAWKSRMRGA